MGISYLQLSLSLLMWGECSGCTCLTLIFLIFLTSEATEMVIRIIIKYLTVLWKKNNLTQLCQQEISSGKIKESLKKEVSVATNLESKCHRVTPASTLDKLNIICGNPCLVRNS